MPLQSKEVPVFQITGLRFPRSTKIKPSTQDHEVAKAAKGWTDIYLAYPEEYDDIVKENPAARLTYVDEESDTVLVGTSVELLERLEEMTPPENTTSPCPIIFQIYQDDGIRIWLLHFERTRLQQVEKPINSMIPPRPSVEDAKDEGEFLKPSEPKGKERADSPAASEDAFLQAFERDLKKALEGVDGIDSVKETQNGKLEEAKPKEPEVDEYWRNLHLRLDGPSAAGQNPLFSTVGGLYQAIHRALEPAVREIVPQIIEAAKSNVDGVPRTAEEIIHDIGRAATQAVRDNQDLLRQTKQEVAKAVTDVKKVMEETKKAVNSALGGTQLAYNNVYEDFGAHILSSFAPIPSAAGSTSATQTEKQAEADSPKDPASPEETVSVVELDSDVASELPAVERDTTPIVVDADAPETIQNDLMSGGSPFVPPAAPAAPIDVDRHAQDLRRKRNAEASKRFRERQKLASNPPATFPTTSYGSTDFFGNRWSANQSPFIHPPPPPVPPHHMMFPHPRPPPSPPKMFHGIYGMPPPPPPPPPPAPAPPVPPPVSRYHHLQRPSPPQPSVSFSGTHIEIPDRRGPPMWPSSDSKERTLSHRNSCHVLRSERPTRREPRRARSTRDIRRDNLETRLLDLATSSSVEETTRENTRRNHRNSSYIPRRSPESNLYSFEQEPPQQSERTSEKPETEEWWNQPIEPRRRRSRAFVREQPNGEVPIMGYPRRAESLHEMPGTFGNEEEGDTVPLLSAERPVEPSRPRCPNLIDIDEFEAPKPQAPPARPPRPSMEESLVSVAIPEHSKLERLDSCIAALIEMGYCFDNDKGEFDLPRLQTIACMANGIVHDAINILEEDKQVTGSILS